MELDRTDAEILRALQADGRLSFRALARRTGVSVPTISARVARLEGMGILTGYRATIDPARLGQTRAVLIVRARRSSAARVSEALAALGPIKSAFEAEGLRIVAEAVVSNSDEIGRLQKRIESMAGVVSCEALVATTQIKDEPRASLSERLTATIPCFQCGKEIGRDPVRWNQDGRTHYFCCTSCEALFRDRYARVKAGAG